MRRSPHTLRPVTEPTDRPRPTPDGSARADRPGDTVSTVHTEPVDLSDPEQAAATVEPITVRSLPGASAAPPGRGAVQRIEVQPSQVVAAAGSAIVSAARVGRLLGRSGWRLARQLPGGRTVEREAQRLQNYAAGEVRRFLQVGAAPSARPAGPEQRAAEYIRSADPGTAPLRGAMSELLERSVESSRTDSRDYLYGTIISQLVPDEARILAAMSDGTKFAAGDVVLRRRRGGNRVLLENVSSVGRQAGLVSPENVPTYLGRLRSLGLIEFGPDDETLAVQYDILATDQTVQDARKIVDSRRRGAVRLEHKTVRMSGFGHEFWAASDPSRQA
jgi:hypothetical protein